MWYCLWSTIYHHDLHVQFKHHDTTLAIMIIIMEPSLNVMVTSSSRSFLCLLVIKKMEFMIESCYKSLDKKFDLFT